MGERSPALSRRTLLGAGALAVGVTGAAVAGTRLAGSSDDAARAEAAVPSVPFHGPHQAGVATVPQGNLTMMAFDLRPEHRNRDSLKAIMKLWTEDASRLTQGRPALADTEPELATDPARLTVTVGLGPSVFDAVGLGRSRPPTLRELPAFSVDKLEPRWSGGDLLLQLCSDSPLAVSHAARILAKNVRPMTTVRWVQRGYRTPMDPTNPGGSMRNLMGQVDGTVTLAADELDRLVWDDGGQRPWFRGGTIAVVRRIRAEMDTWDMMARDTKELVVGRKLDTGAPLTGQHESDVPDFAAHVNGITVIPENSHVALARPMGDTERFLRRPYNYDDTPTGAEITDSGLVFVTFQRDPEEQFVPVQERLSRFDALNEWITPIGSAVFAVLPGVEPGGYLGQGLLEPTAAG